MTRPSQQELIAEAAEVARRYAWSLDDALDIRRRVLLAFEAAERERDPDMQRRLLTFVIVGGGPTGVEMAGALAEIARRTLKHDFRHLQPETARIVLLEGAPDALSAFPDRLRRAAHRSLARLGVEIRTNAIVTAVDADGVGHPPGFEHDASGRNMTFERCVIDHV